MRLTPIRGEASLQEKRKKRRRQSAARNESRTSPPGPDRLQPELAACLEATKSQHVIIIRQALYCCLLIESGELEKIRPTIPQKHDSRITQLQMGPNPGFRAQLDFDWAIIVNKRLSQKCPLTMMIADIVLYHL
jgi:hypothetical protein